MNILNEFSKMTQTLEQQTGLSVTDFATDLADNNLAIWVTLYDLQMDISYTLNVEEKEITLFQLSNEEGVKYLTDQLVYEWLEIARDISTLH